MNQKIKNVTKSIAFVAIIAGTPCNAEIIEEKKVTIIKKEIFNLTNHIAAIIPHILITDNLTKEKRETSLEEVITMLSPVVTHIGLQKIVLPLVEDYIDNLEKSEETKERLKKRIGDIGNFCLTRMILSLLLYKACCKPLLAR